MVKMLYILSKEDFYILQLKVATIVILHVYPTLLEISFAISCSLSTDKLTFTHTKFESKYLIFL